MNEFVDKNYQRTNSKNESIQQKKLSFLEIIKNNLVDSSKEVIVSLDDKGKIIFWQFGTNSGSSRQEIKSVGNLWVNLRSKGNITAVVQYNNILMMGFKSGHVGIFYLGMKNALFDFKVTNNNINNLQFESVRYQSPHNI